MNSSIENRKSKIENSSWHSPRSILTFILVTASLLALDLWLKSWSFEHVADVPVVIDSTNPVHTPIYQDSPVVVIPHVLNLQLTLNSGAVFGLGKGARWFFIAMSLVAVVVIGWIFARSPAHTRVLHLAMACILAGALGNLYDRARFGVVRDMLHLFPGITLPFGLTWPGHAREVYPWIFNLADAALVVGVATLMLILWSGGRTPQNGAKSPS